MNVTSKGVDQREINLGLLLLLAASYVAIVPLFDMAWSSILEAIVISAIILMAALATGSWRRFFVAIAIILSIAEVASGIADLMDFNLVVRLLGNVFFAFIIVMFIYQVAIERNVTIKTVLKVINGYLLMGIVYAHFVSMINDYYPEAYSFSDHPDHLLSEIIYYTFISMTSVGYGDLTPKIPLAKSLATAIAISGQFYVAVIIAMIVGKYSSGRMRQENSSSNTGGT